MRFSVIFALFLAGTSAFAQQGLYDLDTRGNQVCKKEHDTGKQPCYPKLSKSYLKTLLGIDVDYPEAIEVVEAAKRIESLVATKTPLTPDLYPQVSGAMLLTAQTRRWVLEHFGRISIRNIAIDWANARQTNDGLVELPVVGSAYWIRGGFDFGLVQGTLNFEGRLRVQPTQVVEQLANRSPYLLNAIVQQMFSVKNYSDSSTAQRQWPLTALEQMARVIQFKISSGPFKDFDASTERFLTEVVAPAAAGPIYAAFLAGADVNKDDLKSRLENGLQKK